MPELFPKDIEAIVRAAFETHLPGQFWDEKGEEVKSRWRDQVKPAITGRNQTGGIPAIEAGIVKAWEDYTSTKPDTKKLPAVKTVTEPPFGTLDDDKFVKPKKK